MQRLFLGLALACCGLALASGGRAPLSRAPGRDAAAAVRPGSEGCLACHRGIEAMHPAAELSCTDCHGGDATAREKLAAHVAPSVADPGDERVLPRDADLAYRRFVNPMDLRVAGRTCGECHRRLVDDLEVSLHGTTAGHLSDGFYEMGLSAERGSVYGVFPVLSDGGRGGEVERLVQVPAFKGHLPEERLETHYADLARKECMQCHLWSRGRAVRGRVGFDGDYRGDGCAACHVPYALNGLSDSADASANRTEPGHPLRHAMTRAPTTDACAACHYGDASIGMHFRGLSQLPPGAEGGPEIPGTTDAPLNRAFYLRDDAICPPDVHHERGMHCIDCHTLGDVMGDGMLHGQMEHAVEISCEACHGTFESRSTLRTARGTPLEHLFRDGERVLLRSKVTGEVHPVKQVVDVLDPQGPEYNEAAARAMTGAHAQVECYTCHAGWNVNFLGFHFYRNEALTQLDLLSGMRTPGRVTTQDKVFATWKSFYAGFNETGRVAPYLTGFSTMGTVDGEDGERILDQVMPVTAEGLSGMTMIHHQPHSVRPTARACVECHRSSATWGLGSVNFRLMRQLAFVADRRGIEIVAVNRAQLSSSTPLAKFVLPDVVDIEIDADPLQGHARYLYAAEGGRGIHVLDVRDPAHPERVAFVESIGPRGMALAGRYLYVADGIGGLRVYDVSEPEKIHRVGLAPMFDAHEVCVQWPYAYVADGPAGLSIVDVRAPVAPRVVAGIAPPAPGGRENAAIDVEVLFQYSRPKAGPQGEALPWRSEALALCALLDESLGLVLIDVTEPAHPEVLFPLLAGARSGTDHRRDDVGYRGVALRSHVDLATPQGGLRTAERDYAYLLEEITRGNGQRNSFIHVWDVSEPRNPRRVARERSGDSTEMLVAGALYNMPFLQRVLFTPGSEGMYATDVDVPSEPAQVGFFSGLRDVYAVALEEFPLDRMVDEDGRRLKDVSHPGSRWLRRGEIERILSVPGVALGTVDPEDVSPDYAGRSARVFFAQLDRDRSGLLTGDEYERAGGKNADRDADGRITLRELASFGGSFGAGTVAADGGEPLFLETRTDPDGDLARLLDGIDPTAFDADGDDRLERGEMTAAFFAALDLDGDRRLTLAELSRHPGDLRQLRYGDPDALARFAARDRNGGGTVSLAEFRLEEAEWLALDRDASGAVQLAVSATSVDVRRGFVPPPPEWPARRVVASGLPPLVSFDGLMALFDADRDGKLGRRELEARRDLFAEFDRDGDGVVTSEEVQDRVSDVVQAGVDGVADGFLARWDLDGNGTVDRAELPDWARSSLRGR